MTTNTDHTPDHHVPSKTSPEARRAGGILVGYCNRYDALMADFRRDPAAAISAFDNGLAFIVRAAYPERELCEAAMNVARDLGANFTPDLHADIGGELPPAYRYYLHSLRWRDHCRNELIMRYADCMAKPTDEDAFYELVDAKRNLLASEHNVLLWTDDGLAALAAQRANMH